MSDSVWPHRQKPTRLPHPWDSPGKNNSPMHESEKWKWSRSVVFGFPRGDIGKESISQCRRHKRCRSDPWVWKIPWRRKWQSTPVFLPGESHGQRSLASYSPWGRKESDMTEQLTHTQREMSTPIVYWALTVSQAPHKTFFVCYITLILILWGWFPFHRWGSEAHWSYV